MSMPMLTVMLSSNNSLAAKFDSKYGKYDYILTGDCSSK
jgi:hypothetical protein